LHLGTFKPAGKSTDQYTDPVRSLHDGPVEELDPTSRPDAIDPVDVDTPWSGLGGFVGWRARQLWSVRAWRMLFALVVVLFMVARGLVERDPSGLAFGGIGLLCLALWFFAPPILADGLKRLGYAARTLLRRS
jgi:hypothetical protein